MSANVVRFGLFELDRDTRQLHRQGRRVRIQEQPLRVLELLVERPGRLVTRQELRQRLWPDDVNVDFEPSLNAAVKRLRIALSDSGDNPIFIETVPKSGYRFLAPVEPSVVHDSGGARLAVQTDESRPAVEPGIVSQDSSSGPRQATRAASRSRLWWGAIALAALVAVAAFFARPPAPPLRVTHIAKISASGHVWPQESLMSDGTRLYYTAFVPESGFTLRQILLNGNEDLPVSGLPPGTLVRSLSPDGTTFLAISEQAAREGHPSSVWMIPVVGGPPRRVGTIETNDVAWSPGGGTLAYTHGHDVLVAGPDGAAPRTLATVPGAPFYLRWSPDATRLRFTMEDHTGSLAIWEVDADGRHLHALQFDWPAAPMEGFGEWLPDNRGFVFASRRDGLSNLWADDDRADWLHRSRPEPTQLTAGPISYSRPLPSRDGSRLFALGTQPAGELVRDDPDRSEVAPFLDGRAADQVDFSRDGRWIVYVAYPDATLWRAKADGSETLQLTFPPMRAYAPHWSPDGQRIAFTVRLAGALPQIETIAIDGSHAEPIVAEPYAQATPSWSHDGRSILYGRDPTGESRDVAIYRADLVRRTTSQVPGTDGLYAPDVSPDGRHMAAVAVDGHALVIIDADSGRRTTLSSRRAEYPTWSADSQFLYFNTLTGDDRAVFRVRVRDGVESRVATIAFPTTGIFGGWTGLAPDGSLLLLRSHTQTDVYALSIAGR